MKKKSVKKSISKRVALDNEAMTMTIMIVVTAMLAGGGVWLFLS